MLPGTLDLVFAFVIVVAYPLWDYLRGWPAMHRTLTAGRPDARSSVYRNILLQEWAAAAIVAALWLAYRRGWVALGFGLPGGWKLAIAAGMVAAMSALLLMQLRKVGSLAAARRAGIAAGMGVVGLIVPRTRQERAWFAALSVTAGICEELVYRGFLLWALRPWIGVWGAAAVSVAGFTLAHAYQGRGFVVRTGGMGLLFTVLAIGTGSIVPGMLLHAIVDLVGGETGYALVRDQSTASAPA